MNRFWVTVGVLLHPTLWPQAIQRGLISLSDKYPPRWWWPVVRIYGGPEGQQSRLCYMTRIIIGHQDRTWRQIYIHIFHRPDGDRDPHDHPFGFWTFPIFQGYWEEVFEHVDGVGCFKMVFVPRWRWSYRPANHTHRVVRTETGRWPFVTIVWREANSRKWGFWSHALEWSKTVRHFVGFQDYVYGGVDANIEGADEVCPGTAGRYNPENFHADPALRS